MWKNKQKTNKNTFLLGPLSFSRSCSWSVYGKLHPTLILADFGKDQFRSSESESPNLIPDPD